MITYEEFLPALLGRDRAPDPRSYRYDPSVDTRIANEFSTVAYRFGHSMVSPELMLHDDLGSRPSIDLQSAFFAIDEIITDPTLVESLMGGLAHHQAEKLDHMINDDIRNFLFGQAFGEGFDLGALNIQRGRDHGIPPYNAVREAYGLPPRDFTQINRANGDVATRLSSIYPSSNDIDAWVGALAEEHLPGAHVGELVATILIDQFTRLMNGDRFFYTGDRDLESQVVRDQIIDLRNFELADVLRRNGNNRLESIGRNDKLFEMPGQIFTNP